MRIGRRTIIPLVLLLGVAASALAGTEMSVAVAHASTGQSHVVAVSFSPDTFYHD